VHSPYQQRFLFIFFFDESNNVFHRRAATTSEPPSPKHIVNATYSIFISQQPRSYFVSLLVDNY
jgi:hypothetical protein